MTSSVLCILMAEALRSISYGHHSRSCQSWLAAAEGTRPRLALPASNNNNNNPLPLLPPQTPGSQPQPLNLNRDYCPTKPLLFLQMGLLLQF